MSRNAQTALGIGLAIVLLGAIGLLAHAVMTGNSAAGLMGSGRLVTVQASGLSFEMWYTHDTATIKAASHKIVVAPDYLEVDGRRIGVIDPKITEIEVRAFTHSITFLGDGQRVGRWALARRITH